MTTAKEVAKAANVALPTAYEALRGAGRLRPATRQRVLDAADRLNYKPSAAARALNNHTTRQIGLIGKLHPVNVDTYIGANAALLEADRVMSIFTYKDENLGPMQQRAFRERMFDGMVVIDQVPNEIYDELEQIEHCVWANTDRSATYDCIQRNEFAVGQTAAKQLLDAGWRDLVFVYGPMSQEHYSQQERLRGIRDVAEAAGANVHPVLCPEAGTSWRQLDERLTPYLNDSAFIFSDTYRVRAMQTMFLHRGLLPGRDVSIVCCDDTQEFVLTWPELSRASFDRSDLGRQAVEMLIRRINTGKPQPSILVDSNWVAGQTIAQRSR
ncbi:MAG: LacI family DNA-binding transcriptional regulator [Planctomycetota bacterium]